MRLSAVLIAKNEASMLAQALASVKGCDEIVVVDTGSTDATREIARRFTDRVFDFPWGDDFAAARNAAIDHATGDWLLTIDADWTLETPIGKVRAEAEAAAAAGHKAVLCTAAYPNGQTHQTAVLYARDPAVRWVGAVHECLSLPASAAADIRFAIGSSPNRDADPDRNLRILLKSDLTHPRHQFYLGRECYEHGQHINAIWWLQEYLTHGQFIGEIAEAHLTIAKAYWALAKGDKAREACLEAIRVNPDFAEALRFMGAIHNEPWRSRWLRLAAAATNEGVLFVRPA